MPRRQRALTNNPDALRKRLLYIIERTPGITLNDLFHQLGIDKARLRRHIDQLPVIRIAKRTGTRGHQHHYYRWRWWCDCGEAALNRAHFVMSPTSGEEEFELCDDCLSLLTEDYPMARVTAIVYEKSTK